MNADEAQMAADTDMSVSCPIPMRRDTLIRIHLRPSALHLRSSALSKK
jgi:hypothetical protein